MFAMYAEEADDKNSLSGASTEVMNNFINVGNENSTSIDKGGATICQRQVHQQRPQAT